MGGDQKTKPENNVMIDWAIETIERKNHSEINSIFQALYLQFANNTVVRLVSAPSFNIEAQ